jgi:hypothetical protein
MSGMQPENTKEKSLEILEILCQCQKVFRTVKTDYEKRGYSTCPHCKEKRRSKND